MALRDGAGQLSSMLFGTVMNEDVLDLREKLNQLASFASAHNKLIHLNSQNIRRLGQQVQDIASYINTLRSSRNAMLSDIKNLSLISVLEQALAALGNAVNLLLNTNSLIAQNIVDAPSGRVTSSLFPVKDFLKILDLGGHEYKLTPFFLSKCHSPLHSTFRIIPDVKLDCHPRPI